MNCYTADQLQMIQGDRFECKYDSVHGFIGPKQACCGGPVVSTPDWHFQGFRSSSWRGKGGGGGGGGGGWGLYFCYVLILWKFLLLYVYMLVYVLCQYLSSVLFFQGIIHNESFSFFSPEVKLEVQVSQ